MALPPSVPLRALANPPVKVLGSLATLVILIAVGVAVGVTVAKSHKSTSTTSSSSSSSVTDSDPNDPSSFEKDSRLIQSFWGIAYTPEGSQYPDCGNSLGASLQSVHV